MGLDNSPYLLDPDGDVILILPHPGKAAPLLDGKFIPAVTPPKLSFERKESREKCLSSLNRKKTTSFESRSTPNTAASSNPNTTTSSNTSTAQEIPAPESIAKTEEATHIHIHVSSRHLRLASSYFRRSLSIGMRESESLRSGEQARINMDGVNPDAMLVVMRIIHSRIRDVPRIVDLDLLTKVAVVVDYLGCLEAIEHFSDMWIESLDHTIPSNCCLELLQWLCISTVFRKNDIFEEISLTLIWHGNDNVPTLGLPIRDSITAQIDEQRSELLSQIFSSLTNLLVEFREGENGCNFQCNSINYGALAKELSSRGLQFPSPERPFFGYSCQNVITSLNKISSPQSIGLQSDYCKLAWRISQAVSTIKDRFNAFSPTIGNL